MEQLKEHMGPLKRSNARVLSTEEGTGGLHEVVLVDDETMVDSAKKQRCDFILIDDDDDVDQGSSEEVGVKHKHTKQQLEQERIGWIVAEQEQRREQEQAGWAAALKFHEENTVLEREALERSRAVAEQLQRQEFLQAHAQRATGFLDQDEFDEHLAAGPMPRTVMRGDQPLRMNKLRNTQAHGGQQAAALPHEVVRCRLQGAGARACCAVANERRDINSKVTIPLFRKLPGYHRRAHLAPPVPAARFSDILWG